jgi:glycolate oxidase
MNKIRFLTSGGKDGYEYKEFIADLIRITGKDNVVIDPDVLISYSTDETPDLQAIPAIVVRPDSTDVISSIMKLCSDKKIEVTIRGGGTGVVGGALAHNGGLVLSLEKMNKILEIDPENLVAVVQPAVITCDISKEAEKFGLFYPVDPASWESCSIGGNVATSAGGIEP